MSYVPPNIFVNATPFNAVEVQENNDELQGYINGGVIPGDIENSPWVRSPHIMRGTYIPQWNLHEFTTGIVRGGFFQGNNIQIGADKNKAPISGMTSNKSQVFWSIDFVPQYADVSIRLSWQLHPKHPAAQDVLVNAGNQIAQTVVDPNFAQASSTNTSTVQYISCEEHDMGNFRNFGFEHGTPGRYRRRTSAGFIYDTATLVPGQQYSYRFFIGTANVVNHYADLNYDFQLYYV